MKARKKNQGTQGTQKMRSYKACVKTKARKMLKACMTHKKGRHRGGKVMKAGRHVR